MLNINVNEQLTGNSVNLNLEFTRDEPVAQQLVDFLLMQAFEQHEEFGTLDLARAWAKLFIRVYGHKPQVGGVRMLLHDALIEEGLVEESNLVERV